jgi:hypothetical protein
VQNFANRIVTLPNGAFTILSNTDAVRAGIDRMITDYNGRTIRLNVATDSIYTNSLGRAYGGPIVGPGGPRDDLVPIMGSNGEHMWTADEVRAAGGHEEMYRLRRAVLNGTLRLAEGGPVRIPSSMWRSDPPVAVTRVDGGAVAAAQPAAQVEPTVQVVNTGNTHYSYDPHYIARARDELLQRALYALPRR